MYPTNDPQENESQNMYEVLFLPNLALYRTGVNLNKYTIITLIVVSLACIRSW